MPVLSVLIPGRNEEWMARTVQDVLDHSELDTEVIAVIDGEHIGDRPAPHPRLRLLELRESIGQRAATNLAARESAARYLMKLDAHCSVSPGFDRACITALEGHPDWTIVPAQSNFFVFSWLCQTCKKKSYMGPYPQKCEAISDSTRPLKGHHCDGKTFERVIEWRPRPGTTKDFFTFDSEMHFQYQGNWRPRRPRVVEGDLAETMSLLGACFVLDRERYWQIGGLDEKHGSWGQMGTEIACKTWLSGGRLLVHRGAWFSHMFRTRQSQGFGFPYSNSGRQRLNAQEYSRNLWMNDQWPGQVLPLAWLVNKFKFLYDDTHQNEDGTKYEYPNWHSLSGAAALNHIRESERTFYKSHTRIHA